MDAPHFGRILNELVFGAVSGGGHFLRDYRKCELGLVSELFLEAPTSGISGSTNCRRQKNMVGAIHIVSIISGGAFGKVRFGYFCLERFCMVKRFWGRVLGVIIAAMSSLGMRASEA